MGKPRFGTNYARYVESWKIMDDHDTQIMDDSATNYARDLAMEKYV